jgi:flagellar biosynthesis protein FlhB
MNAETNTLIKNWPQFLIAAVLVMIRLSGLMLLAPVFSSAAIAPRIKAGFVIAMTVLLAPAVASVPNARATLDVNAVLGELGVGLVFGLSLMLMTEALTFAGMLLGMQFSFSLVNLMDPNSMIETPVLGQMLNWLGVLVIIGSGLDRSLLATLVRSFRTVPVGQAVIEAKTGAALVMMAGRNLPGGVATGCSGDCGGACGGDDDFTGGSAVPATSGDGDEHSVEDDGVLCRSGRKPGSVAGMDRAALYRLARCGRKVDRHLMSEKGTEQATPQRKKKAKEKGDGVRSRELLSAMAMLGGVLMLGATAHGFVARWGKVYTESLRSAAVGELNGEQRWNEAIRKMLEPALLPVGLVLAASFTGTLIAGVAQAGGIEIYPSTIEPQFSKLNPVTNLGQLFSLRSATRVVKSMVPAAAMVVFGWGALKSLMLPMPVMSLARLPATFSASYGLALDAAWITLAWSALDYAIEWRSWNERLKMSKQEMREEVRDAMGNPEVKGKVRQIQRAMRKRKVKADMSKASVVITNPTHYAVALEFSFETMQAPVVLAKGRDLLAAEIREEARWAGIPIIENPPLARSLYRTVEQGQSIPFELYATVAGILAYLYRQKVEERMKRERQAQQAQQQKENQATAPLVGLRGYGGGM